LMTFRSQLAWILLIGAGTALGASCSASSDLGFDGRNFGGSGSDDAGPEDAVLDRSAVDVPVPEAAPPVGDGGRSELCGDISVCSPDPATAENCELDPAPAADAGSDDSDAGEEAGAAVPDAADASDSGDVKVGCYLTRGSRGVRAECRPAGAAGVEQPCLSSSDCSAGLACVGEGSAGVCRPLCCTQPCDSETVCAERPLVELDSEGAAPLKVPVCVKPDRCDPAKPPCDGTNDETCACTGGMACLIVKDGTSSCDTPGDGMAGDPCPCDWGHVCSQGANKCLKLCSLAYSDPDADDCKCMATSGLPEGYGVCAVL
jgi:hypothetical protein